jgi:hypothetical protein
MLADLFRTRYRVVGDRYLGFEAQFRYWWMPFYMQMWGAGPANTHRTVDDAERFIAKARAKVVLTDTQLRARNADVDAAVEAACADANRIAAEGMETVQRIAAKHGLTVPDGVAPCGEVKHG